MTARQTPTVASLIVAAAASLALLLSGCQPGIFAPSATGTSPAPSASASAPANSPVPSATASPSASVSPSPSASEEPTTPPIAGDIPCDEVLTADQLYEFSPNFAAASDAGTLPAALERVATAGGTVCAYRHVTGTDRLIIAALRGSGGDAAFALEAGVGSVVSGGDVTVGVASEYFGSAEDAQALIDQVRQNLG